MTIDSKYIPTPAEYKLIEILVNPEHYGKSITDICELAGICRNVYYEAIKKPEFIDYLNKITIEVLKSKINDVITATFKYATTEKRNSQDRITLLKMAKVLKDEQNINVSTDQKLEDLFK
jgi:hypothetical protein